MSIRTTLPLARVSSRRSLAGVVAYVVAYALVVSAMPGPGSVVSLAGHVGLLLPPLILGAAVLRRRQHWRGCQRLFWDVLAIGAALWVVGHLGWAYDDLVSGRPTWLAWHTIFSLTGGIAPLIALLTRPYLGPRSGAVRHVSLALAGFGFLVIFVFAYFMLVPGMVKADASAERALLALVHGNRIVVVAAAGLSLAAAWRTEWRRPLAYVAAGAAIGALARLFTSAAIAADTYTVGSLYDLAWIIPFASVAAGAMSAPASPARDENPSPGPVVRAPGALLALPVILIPVIGYGWLYLQPLDATLDPFRAVLTGVMTIAGIGVLSLRLASQGTELERADARLRLLAAATEQTADLILITRADGTIEHANDAFVRTLGYSRAELQGVNSADLRDPSFDDAVRQIHEEVLERGIWRGTLLRRRRDGSTFPAACTVVSLKDEAGAVTHYVGVERDIGDDLRLREQLVHSERLQATGDLVAGVAHEINNPLQSIIGSVELLMEEGPDDGTRRDLEIVRREATRAAQIVRNLLSFVRRGGSDRAPADLNAIARATVDLREFHLQQRDIAVRLDLSALPLDVMVNREEIQQVVFNLLLNAEQAILTSSASGTITVRTSSAGGFHVLEVIDSGPGVAVQLRGRIFEPFFTTRPVGEGTGLGLSISHGIAASHGGTLEFRPADGGALFRLAIPAMVQAEPPAAEPAVSTGAASPVALVVDDEAPIRRLLVRLLERRGYRAVEAPSGQEALELAASTPPDVVLCDVRMPGMTGPELYRAFERAAIRPRRFIFITGDRTAIQAGEPLFADVPVLAKPFTAASLDAVLANTPTRS